jgi:hypothetical protein
LTFLTDRERGATWLDADHRQHAVCELAIREDAQEGPLTSREIEDHH